MFTVMRNDVVDIVVYRPSSGNIQSFLKHVENVLIFVCTSEFKAVIIGDINIHWLSVDHAQSEYLSTLLRYGFESLNNSTTGIITSTETQIQTCFSNTSEKLDSGVLLIDVSTILLYFAYFAAARLAGKLNETTIETFKYMMMHTDLPEVISDSNVASSSRIHRIMVDSYDHAFPPHICKKSIEMQESLGYHWHVIKAYIKKYVIRGVLQNKECWKF